MVTSIIEALSRFAASFMAWFQEKQLIDAGRNEVKLEDAQKQIATQEKLNEINTTPLATTPESILNKL